MKMKAILSIVNIVSILSVAMLIISAVVIAFAGSHDLYRWGFEKNQIAERIGISHQQLGEAGRAMAGYLVGSYETPQIIVDIKEKQRPLYNEKELVHLEDVRFIVLFFRLLLIISIVLFIATGFACAGLNLPAYIHHYGTTGANATARWRIPGDR